MGRRPDLQEEVGILRADVWEQMGTGSASSRLRKTTPQNSRPTIGRAGQVIRNYLC